MPAMSAELERSVKKTALACSSAIHAITESVICHALGLQRFLQVIGFAKIVKKTRNGHFNQSGEGGEDGGEDDSQETLKDLRKGEEEGGGEEECNFSLLGGEDAAREAGQKMETLTKRLRMMTTSLLSFQKRAVSPKDLPPTKKQK